MDRFLRLFVGISSFADCTDFSVKFNLKSSNPIFEFDREVGSAFEGIAKAA